MLSSQFFLNSCPNQFWKILDKGKREVFNFYQFLREEWKHRRNIERMFHCHRRWVEEQHNRWLFSSVWLSTSIIESGGVRSYGSFEKKLVKVKYGGISFDRTWEYRQRIYCVTIKKIFDKKRSIYVKGKLSWGRREGSGFSSTVFRVST